MKRLFLSSIASSLALVVTLSGARAAPLSRDERDATIRYVASLQNPDGGFRTSAAQAPSQLGAVVSGLRALRYLGKPGSSQQKGAALRFIRSCEHTKPRAFSEAPGEEPAVIPTAHGMMALGECRGDGDAPEREYLEENAHTIPELYMAEASLDAVHVHPKTASQWGAVFQSTRNPDGTFGKGAYDTATAVSTLFRLGAEFSHHEGAAAAIRAAQQPDGGFAATGDHSDLPSTYRMMRALYLLHAKPNLARLTEFIGRCRNSDGGYGASPGQPSTVSATYNAAIVMYWVEELERGR